MKTTRFDFVPTRLSGLILVSRQPITDQRGFFSRFFCIEEFERAGVLKPIVQINHTYTSKKGTVRGLHYQFPPYAEWKMVSCLHGAIFDVAVDIRQGSSTFLQWHGEILSALNHHSLLIPEGFAHGFQTLTEDCELLYLHSVSYRLEAQGALNIRDPRVGVAWPLEITEISERDAQHPFLSPVFDGISL